MICTRLCNNIVKDVFKRTQSSSCIWRNSREWLHRTTYRNLHSSKITFQNEKNKAVEEYFRARWEAEMRQKNITTRNYLFAILFFILGCTWASVPIYRVFCQSTGYGGTTKHDVSGEKMKSLTKNPNRKITVRFNSDVSGMAWTFKPQQSTVEVYPGETALAFFTAKNNTDEPITGVSTYNVVPFEAGPYFNKIQCFCFEEQRLNPHEEVDMPVFFYIDPEFATDPNMLLTDEVVLSYTFFQAKEGMKIPLPGFLKRHGEKQAQVA